LPAIPVDRLQAGGRGEADALSEVGRQLFGAYPVEAGDGDIDELVGSPIGRHVRSYLPEELDDSHVVGAMARIAAQLQNRILKRWRADRGTFADWCRLNVEDLSLQEAVAAYQAGAAHVEAALAKLDKELAGDTQQWAERLGPSATPAAKDHLAAARKAWDAWQPIRRAVTGLVWRAFFYADPASHGGDGYRLSFAAGWMHMLIRRGGGDPSAAQSDEMAQEFFLLKVLQKDLLLRFKTELGSSFIQWLKISVENYTRDELSRPPTPEEIGFSDALQSSLSGDGSVTTRTSRLHDDSAPRVSMSDGDDEGGDSAGSDVGGEGDDLLEDVSPLAFISTGGAEAGEDRLTALLHHVMPALLAEPFHRTFARLFLGLPLIREDCELIARQRLVTWAAGLAVAQLSGEAAVAPDGHDAAMHAAFVDVCKEYGFGDATRKSQRLPKKLAPNARPAAAAWFREQLSPTLLSSSKRGHAEVPAALKPASAEATKAVEQLQRILMAIESAPSGSLFATLADAIGDQMEAIEQNLNADAKEFERDCLRQISQNRLRIKRLEGRLRNLPPDSAEAVESAEKLARLRRIVASKADEMNRKSFSIKDADIAALLGIDPKSVAPLRTRVKKQLTDFHTSDQLANARNRMLAKMKRGKKARTERYDRALEALAAFAMFPASEPARKALAAATDNRLTPDLATKLQSALADVRAGGGGAAESLHELSGKLLGRDELVALGADADDVVAYEDLALRVLPGVIWLRQLSGGR
ncbi:MAG: hypothetical protein AB7S36_23875, partial [Planctomycetota bacterium]